MTNRPVTGSKADPYDFGTPVSSGDNSLVETRLGLPEDADFAHQAGGGGFGGHLDEHRLRHTVTGQRQPGPRRRPRVAADHRHRRHGATHDLRQESASRSPIVRGSDRTRPTTASVATRCMPRPRCAASAEDRRRPGSLSAATADLLVLACSHAQALQNDDNFVKPRGRGDDGRTVGGHQGRRTRRLGGGPGRRRHPGRLGRRRRQDRAADRRPRAHVRPDARHRGRT